MDIIREQFNMFPGTRESCVELLKSGHLLGIAPGGAYECMFADNNYPLLWGSRQGFAAVAIAADVPIIPIFTENIRESTLNMAGRMKSSKNYFETLYRATKLPVSPSYGLFPVKLKTHIGTPIYPKKDMTPEQMVTLTTYAIEQMISKYQQLPGSLPRALKERVNYEAAKIGLDLSRTDDDDDDDEEEDEESFVDYVRDWFGRMPKE